MPPVSASNSFKSWLPSLAFGLVAIWQMGSSGLSVLWALLAAFLLSPALLPTYLKHWDKQQHSKVKVSVATIFVALLLVGPKANRLPAEVSGLSTSGWGSNCIKDCAGEDRIQDPDIIYRIYSCENLASLYYRTPPSVAQKEWHKRVKARAEVLGCSNL